MGKGDKKQKDQGQQGGGGAPAGPVKCGEVQCKENAKRFGFCPQHYEHFKFGLITRKGEPVSDYEKKLEHFKNFKEKSKQVA